MSRGKVKKKLGRPTIYTPELAARICGELACGRSLRSVCKADDMPGLETVFRWLREKRDFQDQYARAKNESADALVEQMLDIADDATGDFVDDGEGNARFNPEHVQRSRLRVDTRKWIASKLKPKRYGERLDMSHGVQPDNPLAALIRSVQGSSFKPVPSHVINEDEIEDA
jgi:hypothetical protein